MSIVTLGLDLGKRYVHAVGFDGDGREVFRKRFPAGRVAAYTASMPGCVIAMEASMGSHQLARRFAAQGHEPRLMSAKYVRPYASSQKTDYRDAQACAEAATRPTMRFVAVKSQAQQDVQSLHRFREGLVRDRTAVINRLRATLLEREIVVAQGPTKLARALPAKLEEAGDKLSPAIRDLIEEMRDKWRDLDERIARMDEQLRELAQRAEGCQRLTEIPGIGPITATALVAAAGDGSQFAKGRDMAAWLGLTPREYSTGGKQRLLGISKRGNKQVRKLLVHAARAVVDTLAKQATRLGRWLSRLMARAHRNVAVVALANKLARWAWAVRARGARYQPALASG